MRVWNLNGLNFFALSKSDRNVVFFVKTLFGSGVLVYNLYTFI